MIFASKITFLRKLLDIHSPQDHFLFFYRPQIGTKEMFFTTKGILKYLLTTNIKNRFSHGNIYIIQTREFLQSDIFKIGRTRFSTNKRLKQYPQQSILIHEFNYTGDINNCETMILLSLKTHKHIIHRFDLGKEFFEGSIDSIRSAIKRLYGTFVYEKKRISFKNNKHIWNYYNIWSIRMFYELLPEDLNRHKKTCEGSRQ